MRKIAANYIFPIANEPIKNGLITLDDKNKIISIGQLGDREEESVEFYNGILCPGFVNAHCHLELSHLEGKIPEHTGLVGFIQRMSTLAMPAGTEEQLAAACKADTAMQKEGTVAVADISNTDLTFDLKAGSPILYHNFIEVFGSNPATAQAGFNSGVALVAKAELRGLEASLTPHASYSMSDQLFKLTVGEALKKNILSLHNQESKDENTYFSKGKGSFAKLYEQQAINAPQPIGKSSVHRLLSVLNERTIRLLLVHNIYTSQQDIDAVMRQNPNTSWVLCPNSNLYIENQPPPVERLRKNRLRIAVGTDSYSSNTRLSMLEELKTLSRHFPAISLNELLGWATLNGASALGIDRHFGSFEVGKGSGVVLIEGVNFENMTLTDKARSSLLAQAAIMRQ